MTHLVVDNGSIRTHRGNCVKAQRHILVRSFSKRLLDLGRLDFSQICVSRFHLILEPRKEFDQCSSIPDMTLPQSFQFDCILLGLQHDSPSTSTTDLGLEHNRRFLYSGGRWNAIEHCEIALLNVNHDHGRAILMDHVLHLRPSDLPWIHQRTPSKILSYGSNWICSFKTSLT